MSRNAPYRNCADWQRFRVPLTTNGCTERKAAAKQRTGTWRIESNQFTAKFQLGYRRMRDVLIRECDIHVSDNHVLRIMRILGIQSTVKFQRKGCTKSASDPQHVAENILNRDFHADKPNEKWLTDVTEFKYINENEVHKIYLSAILDLCDKRVVSFEIGERNNNSLVFSTFDSATAANPDAHPLFHSDRGFQYTSRVFHQKLIDAGMT